MLLFKISEELCLEMQFGSGIAAGSEVFRN
jgi:hypothetical protein